MDNLNLSAFSKRYAVRKMTENDLPLLYDLYKGNKLFYSYSGQGADEKDILHDLTVLPPGKESKDKLYCGFFEGEHLVAVLDLINGYPDDGTAFIGLFMMHMEGQGKSLGSALISELCGYLKQAGFARVRLGYDPDNPQSSHFWQKNGFLKIKEVSQKEGILVVAERSLS